MNNIEQKLLQMMSLVRRFVFRCHVVPHTTFAVLVDLLLQMRLWTELLAVFQLVARRCFNL